jgi:hypothetical protein
MTSPLAMPAQRGTGNASADGVATSAAIRVEALYLYVVQDPGASSPTHKTLVWSDVFPALDLSHVSPFVRQWLPALTAS